MRLLLAGSPDPIQVGAFLMLLRYRGEDPEEITGLVLGAATATRIEGAQVDLDWPSYGAGRTRGAPWFLLSALALARAGVRVLMHGTNEFSGGITVGDAIASLGISPAEGPADARARLSADRFAYVPIGRLSPRLAALLGLRRLLGLRSPINTVARLLDPAGAAAGVDGVFHPPYIETHLAVAERLGRKRLLVLKGGGGEAERNPSRATTAHLWIAGQGRQEVMLPAIPWPSADADEREPAIADIWRGQAVHPAIEARIVGTIGLALLALGQSGDDAAGSIWRARLT
jgi:anthranilate phosphoribosyltransferase